MQVNEASKILDSLLAPITTDDFFENYVSKKVLYIPASTDENSLEQKQLIIGDDPAKTLLGHTKYSNQLTCHADQVSQLPPEPRTVANPEDYHSLIKEYHDRGYTVRIPDLLDLSSNLSHLTRALEVLLHVPMNTVAFWSTGNKHAPVHYDEVDIIVIHLSGRKKWYVSDAPSTYPNCNKYIGKALPELGSHKTYEVGPGDILYVPRGTPHAVDSHCESLHLSINFKPVTKQDALTALVDYLADQEVSLRGNLNDRADDLACGRASTSMINQIKDALDILTTKGRETKVIAEALRLRYARTLIDLPKLPRADLTKLGKVTISSHVKHVPLAMAQVNVTTEYIDFRQPGLNLLINKQVKDAARFIADTPEFKVYDIPGQIDDSIRVQLIEHFIQNGFLTFA